MSVANKVSHVTAYQRPWWKSMNHWWPLFIFITIVILAVVLYTRGGKYRVMAGTAERIVETIAPLESARVVEVYVTVGDRVKTGDVIAQLDTSLIDAESAIQAENMLQARLEARLDQLTLERQFATTLQDAEQALREAQVQFRIHQVELESVRAEVRRLEPLLEQRLVDAGTLLATKSREAVLSEMVELAPVQIEDLEAEVLRAEAQQKAAMTRLEEMGALLDAGTEGSAEAINLLQIRRDSYTLRARQDGVVAEVDARPGDVIPAGGAIASLVVDAPHRIVGFLPESNVSEIEVGTPANIYPRVSLRESGVIPAHVIEISPAVYSLPERASPIRGQVVRGRRIIFGLDEDRSLVPGETVSIEIRPGLKSVVSAQ